MARIHRRTIQKDLHDPDNHNGVITHLEPDILECEVKWVLGSITANKVSGDGGISAELFQFLKDDAVKVLHSICQQIWKTYQWPQDWKMSIFIPIPRKDNAKNVQATAQSCTLSPCLLTYIQSTSSEVLVWMKHKLESRLPGEISVTSDMQMTSPLCQRVRKNWRVSWWKWKRRVKKLAWK